MIVLPKMDLSWIPVKILCEECGGDGSLKHNKRFCSNTCRQRWNYKNNTQLRLKQIERSRERVEENRRMDKFLKEKIRVSKLIEDTKMNEDIIRLYNMIHKK